MTKKVAAKSTSQTQPLRPLTPKEKRVMEFLEVYCHHHGVAPSYQEIKDHFGFASFNSVQRYLKQLQSKNYIHIPGGNQKRAITLLQSSQALQTSLSQLSPPTSDKRLNVSNPQTRLEAPPRSLPVGAESLALPLLGRVAAGSPIEALEHNEFVDVPMAYLRNPDKSFALRVEGQSMIEDGILDGDLIFVQRQEHANNGDTVVAVVDDEATVKKFYLHRDRQLIHSLPQVYAQESGPVVELRPANSSMQSLWFRPEQVQIQGVVVGLLRQL